MVESVALSSTQKLSILERTRIAELRDQASRRLATGRRVNDLSDDPQDYLRAQALANRVSGLLGAKSGIGQGIESLLTAQTGLEAVQKLSEQLKGIAISAQSASGTCQRRSKISPKGGVKLYHFDVYSDAMLRVVPVVHRRDPRCFV